MGSIGASVEQPVAAIELPRPLLNRNELLSGLLIVGCANGVIDRIIENISGKGIEDALANTFGISAIVWIACYVGIRLIARAPLRHTRPVDLAIAAMVLIGFLVPSSHVSWIVISAVAAYIIGTSSPASPERKGACILLAVTVPMFWSKMIFLTFSDVILQFDAIFISWVVGTERIGNAVQFADSPGYLWIAPGCSSIANVSVAILCWVLFSQASDNQGARYSLGWVALSCCCVVLINVIRISIIGFNSDLFDLAHGPIGSALANWTTFIVTVGICALGTRRGRHAFV